MTAEWMLDSLRGFLQSPIWTLTMNSFIDHKCVVFDPGEENKFSYTEIHNEYSKLVEDMLEGFSSDFRISPEQFVSMCDQGLASGTFDEKLFEHIFAADEFLMFKSMMVQRNIQLHLQAIELMRSGAGQAGSLRQSLPPSYESVMPGSDQRSLPPAATVEEESHQPTKESIEEEKKDISEEPQLKEDEEERILREVIEQSKLDYQSPALKSTELEKFLEEAKQESEHLHELKQLEEEQMARHLQMALILSEEEAQKMKEEKITPGGDQQSTQGSSNSNPVMKQTKVDVAQKLPESGDSPKQFVAALPPIVGSKGCSLPAAVLQPHTNQPEPSIWEACLETNGSDSKHGPPLTPAQTDTLPATSNETSSLSETKGRTFEEKGEPADTDPERRAAYWRTQRDKLLALKQEERGKHMEKAVAAQQQQRPKTAAMARRVVADPGGQTVEDSSSTTSVPGGERSESEEKRRTLLNALTQRLKKDLVENLANSS